MPKFGDKYCFQIANDPTVCPQILGHEAYLWSDLKRRTREKCIECDLFRQDLRALRDSEPVSAERALALLDEVVLQGQKLTQFRRSIEIHAEMIGILSHLSSTLKLAFDLNEILFKAMVAFTAGGSFGFNRGVALLADGDQLEGYFALGPRDLEEAERVWRELSEQDKSIIDLLRYTPETFAAERQKFSELLDASHFSVREEPFKNLLEQGGAVLQVGPREAIPPALRAFYGETPFWIVPLLSHSGVPLGALLFDNFLVPRSITDDDRRAMEIFAAEISLALERALTLQELQEKIQRLEDANRRVEEAQEIIFRLRESAAAGQMVLQFTHSIKNPLVAIGGLARRLERKLANDSVSAKFVQAIAREALRLEETVRDCVKFAESQQSSDKEPLNVNQIIEALQRDKREVSRINRVKYQLDLASDMQPVMGSARQLYNCLENLINNAVEAMPKGGEVFISTSQAESRILVRIRDTGPGISQDALSNVFKPFFTTKPTGSGLGLITSREILENMGGSLSVSVLPGQGCQVDIELPTISGGD